MLTGLKQLQRFITGGSEQAQKKAQAITVSAEKQREHNVRTHSLRVEDSCCRAKQTNKCSEKESIWSNMKRNINTEKHRNARKDARKTRPHRTYVPIMRCTKAQRWGEPTNRRLNGTRGGEVHPMGRNALTIE